MLYLCYVNLLTSVTWFLAFVHHLCPEKEHTAAGSSDIPAVRLKCMKVDLKGCSQSPVNAYSLRVQCCHSEIQSATSVSSLSIRSYQKEI